MSYNFIRNAGWLALQVLPGLTEHRADIAHHGRIERVFYIGQTHSEAAAILAHLPDRPEQSAHDWHGLATAAMPDATAPITRGLRLSSTADDSGGAY